MIKPCKKCGRMPTTIIKHSMVDDKIKIECYLCNRTVSNERSQLETINKWNKLNTVYSIGNKVTYRNHNTIEKGIVKSISDDEHVFVVYHCDNNWDFYEDYTAARTNICDLVLGWPNE